MFDEIKKSISATLYERTASPLFGAFLFSWLVWNWKIIVLLFFTSSEEIEVTKFEFIDNNLLNVWSGVIYPVISTALILTGYAWLSEKAYKLWLYFEKKKSDSKQEIEKTKRLTIEQSIKLRSEFNIQREQFEKILQDKDDEIKGMKILIDETLPQEAIDIDEDEKNVSDSPLNQKDLELFFSHKLVIDHFSKVQELIIRNEIMHGEIPQELISFLVAFNIIKSLDRYGRYQWTEKGTNYLKEYFRRKISNN